MSEATALLPSKSSVLANIRNFFHYEWATVKEVDVDLTLVTGGYCNTVIMVQRKANHEVQVEPVSLIYRLHGNQVHERGQDDSEAVSEVFRVSQVEEALVVYELSKRGQGPILYGIFEQGRIEEFVDSHTLTEDYMRDREVRRQVAERYAHLNAVQLPIRDREEYIHQKILSCTDELSQERRHEHLQDPFVIAAVAKYNIDTCALRKHDFTKEFLWMTRVRKKIDSRRGLSPFDCNFLNVLIRKNPAAGAAKILVIDHESTWMGTRGDTLAGHFMNRTIRFTDPVKKVIPNSYPSDDERREFVMDYLLQSSKLMDLDPKLDSVAHVMLEADFSILTVLLYFEFLFKDISTSVRFADAFIQIPPHLIQMYQERKSFLLTRCPDFGKL